MANELATKLVGIDAISVNPDAVEQVRHSVAVVERRILLREATQP